MIKHISFVSIPCADQKRALEFYTKRLGFTVFTDQPFDEAGQRWIELKIASAQTKLVLFTSDDYKDMIGKRTNFTLSVDDLDRTYAELRDNGVEFICPPTKAPWGAYAILVDSEGNKLLLGQA
jgi:predicted enzyme related to lactoylglutathione lyase